MRKLILGLLVALLCCPAAADFQVNQLIGFAAGGKVRTISAATEWQGATANYTFSGDDIESAANDRAIRTVTTFPGDFEFVWTFRDRGGGSWVVGFYPLASDGTFNQNSGNAGVLAASGVAGSYTFLQSSDTTGDLYAANSVVAGNVFTGGASGHIFKIQRIGSAWTFWRDTGSGFSLLHTWSATSSTEMRLAVADGGFISAASNIDIDDVSWTK